jgi:hypothetical protein
MDKSEQKMAVKSSFVAPIDILTSDIMVVRISNGEFVLESVERNGIVIWMNFDEDGGGL